METYGGLDVYIHVFLTSALVGGECSASRPGRFTPVEKSHRTHWIGGWAGPGTGMDDVEIRKILPYRDSNHSAVQPVASRYTDCASPAPTLLVYKKRNRWTVSNICVTHCYKWTESQSLTDLNFTQSCETLLILLYHNKSNEFLVHLKDMTHIPSTCREITGNISELG
jgi:hypothetical protein